METKKIIVSFFDDFESIDKKNSNIDIHIISEDKSVYVVSLFTPENTKTVFNNNPESYFLCPDMMIVEEISKKSVV